MPELLAIEDLEIRYGAVPAVRGLSATVAEGEIVGLIGPNGAGKSSTLLAVLGAVPIRAGEIRLRGESIAGERTERLVRKGIALVPERRHIFPDLTVGENLELGMVGRDGREGGAADLKWVRELFPVVAEFAHRKAGVLSGGQQQQLAIARALAAGPELLLLDEPSLGLAPSVVEIVWEALREIQRRGVTILLVEQRAQITIELADRTYVMSNGELRTVLEPADAGDTGRIASAYFGGAAEAEVPPAGDESA